MSRIPCLPVQAIGNETVGSLAPLVIDYLKASPNTLALALAFALALALAPALAFALALAPPPPSPHSPPPTHPHARSADAFSCLAVWRRSKGVLAAFEAAGMADFAGHVVHEQVRTPLEWRDKYALRRGAVFGLSHNLAQLSLLRPARRHAGARGLHWVGASTRPGNGVPLVLIGAELAASEALQDLGVTEGSRL